MDASELKPGTKVSHTLFGIGTVRNVLGTGASAKVSIDFGSSVGAKTLVAGAAPLRLAGDASTARQHWCEILIARGRLKAGQRMPALAGLRETISACASSSAFWSSVRDVLRANQSPAPRVLDAPNGCVSISVREQLEIEIRIRHEELLQPAQVVLGRAVLDVMARECLREFEIGVVRSEYASGVELLDGDVVTIEDSAPEQLPDRAPRRAPVRVRPKGVITNRPRRRDDY
ncbi:MAG TPA: hypothetical protein VGP72_02960 [Planctomycetota bacterium]|jgi:hypothetical protein